MTDPVFYAPAVTVDGSLVPLRDGAKPGRTLVLGGEEGRHATKVQRLREGESVDLVDGEGFRAKTTVTKAERDFELAAEVQECIREAPDQPQLVLVQGLAKGGRDEQAVETATELGVDRVIPWQAERSIVRWDTRKKGGPQARWRRILLAAMKQSRRATLPVLEPAADSGALTQEVERAVANGSLVLICHESASESIREVLETNTASESPAIVVVVGPEGGITDGELESLVKAGGKPVRLGPHILRSASAGPAALAIANALAGRW